MRVTSDSGYFLDSGVVGCEGTPNLDTGLVATTRGPGLDSDDPALDRDGDGFIGQDDCDDADPMVFPGAPERCDGADTDCDPTTGEDGLVTVDAVSTFTSLEDAVRATSPGSEVVLCRGEFEGPIWLRDDLTVHGRYGSDETTIRHSGASRANLLRVQRGDLRLSGVTLTGSDVGGAYVQYDLPYASDRLHPFWPAGAALSVGACGSVVARDVVVSGNVHYADGGGVASTGAAVWMFDSRIEGNQAEGSGGGLRVEGGLHLVRTVVHDNVAASSGGGIWVVDGTDPVELLTCEITGNTAQSGGGVYASYRDLDLFDTTVSGNHAISGGGLMVPGSRVDATDSVVTQNVAEVFGGGVYQARGSWTRGSVVANEATDGGGFHIGGFSSPEETLLDGVHISSNTALGNGGGLWVGSPLDAFGIELTGNEAANEGSGAYLEDPESGLDCRGCDFGSLGEDNVGGDVFTDFYGESYDFDQPARKTCSAVACADSWQEGGYTVTRIREPSEGSVWTIDVDGPHMVVGGTHECFTLREEDGAWLETELPGGCGLVVALHGEWLAVPDPEDPANVHVRHWDGGEWAHLQTLSPSPGLPVAFLDLRGEWLAVGVDEETVDGVVEAGAVVMYQLVDGQWTYHSTLTAEVPSPDRFGAGVTLGDGQLAVNTLTQAVHLFELEGGGWASGLVFHQTGIWSAWYRVRFLEDGYLTWFRDEALVWDEEAVVVDSLSHPLMSEEQFVDIDVEGDLLAVGFSDYSEGCYRCGVVEVYRGDAPAVRVFEADRAAGAYLGQGVKVHDERIFVGGNDSAIYVLEATGTDPAW